MSKPTPPEARIFEVETPFHRKARRQGGVSREKAIEAAQARIEEAKPSFESWLDSELKEFASLAERARQGEDGSVWLDAVGFRARQLRDSSTTLGFELLSFIATSLCEILESVEAGAACNMEAVRCHMDALLLAGQKSYRRLRPEQVPDLTDGLHRVVKHVTN
jgi:hypothetical protein